MVMRITQKFKMKRKRKTTTAAAAATTNWLKFTHKQRCGVHTCTHLGITKRMFFFHILFYFICQFAFGFFYNRTLEKSRTQTHFFYPLIKIEYHIISFQIFTFENSQQQQPGCCRQERRQQQQQQHYHQINKWTFQSKAEPNQNKSAVVLSMAKYGHSGNRNGSVWWTSYWQEFLRVFFGMKVTRIQITKQTAI